MQTTPTRIEAFLLIDQPRQRIGHWINALAALDSPFAPTVAEVVAYYDPTTDQALIDLLYEPHALDDTGLQYVMNVAILAEVGMVQPATLSDGERTRFLSTRLARCSIRMPSQVSTVSALTELVKRIKSERAPSTKPVVPPPPPPVVTAKGTRDKLERLTSPQGDALIARLRPVPASASDKDDRTTVPMGMAAIAELSAKTRSAGMIYARYLRGGRWVPVRVGALSLKGSALLTGALPRMHDRVDVELSFGTHRARVRGMVCKVSTTRESSTTGASTFSVLFNLDETARAGLTALLIAAREAKVTIKPPPARTTRRFPVEWQVVLGTLRGAVKAIAHDVSTTGMFVHPNVALDLHAHLNFSVVLDDGSAPIAGRARVVRAISEADASEAGLVAGFGLEIVEMTEPDRMRWLGFIARIERRAEKRVLIGAEPERLAELQAHLASLGYTVVGGTDPGALVQLANAETRPADAVLLDSGWLQNEASIAIVENLMAARNVPCVTMNGEVRRARQTIDRLLEVVV
jgi:hypothetical protein